MEEGLNLNEVDVKDVLFEIRNLSERLLGEKGHQPN